MNCGLKYVQFDPKEFIRLNYSKFIYNEKATNFCKISTADLSYVVTVKSTVDISQNFVGFSEYMNCTSCSLSMRAYARIWRDIFNFDYLITYFTISVIEFYWNFAQYLIPVK